jgi:hypothetical protein
LLSVIAWQSPGGSSLWIFPLLLSINIVVGSVIAVVWQSRNAEGWRRVPLLPIRGRWLCYAVCGFLLIPLALTCAFTAFACLLLLPGW